MKRLIAAVSLSAVFGAIAKPSVTTLASYDIELEFIGIAGAVASHLSTAVACTAPVNPNGYDRMVGTVTGNETSGVEEDIEYQGMLSRTTKIGFCELRSTGPREDQKADCAATLTGSATMNLSLLVYGTRDRGAWLKAAPAIGVHGATVTGNCDPPEVAEIRNAYPGSGPALRWRRRIARQATNRGRILPGIPAHQSFGGGNRPSVLYRRFGPAARRLLPTRPRRRRLVPLGETEGSLNAPKGKVLT